MLQAIWRFLFPKPTLQAFKVYVAKCSTPTVRHLYRAHVKAYGVTSPQAKHLRAVLETRAHNAKRHGHRAV